MWFLIGLIGVGLAILLIRMMPKPEDAKAGDVELPKVEEGDEYGRIYGTQWVTDPQVAWWGDVHKIPIRKKAKK